MDNHKMDVGAILESAYAAGLNMNAEYGFQLLDYAEASCMHLVSSSEAKIAVKRRVMHLKITDISFASFESLYNAYTELGFDDIGDEWLAKLCFADYCVRNERIDIACKLLHRLYRKIEDMIEKNFRYYDYIDGIVIRLSEIDPDFSESHKNGSAIINTLEERGDIESHYEIGSRYKRGWGVPKDACKAKEHLHKAAERGHFGAQCSLAWMYKEEQMHQKSEYWQHRAAESNTNQQQQIGYTELDKGNKSEAEKWFCKAAGEDEYYQLKLGMMYFEGVELSRNYQEAYKWFYRSARNGESIAQYFLGEMYAQGLGVEQDILESRKWFQMATERGAAEVYKNIAHLCMLDIRDLTDNQKESQKYRMIIDRHLIQMQADLSGAYQSNLDVRRSYHLARKYFQMKSDLKLAEKISFNRFAKIYQIEKRPHENIDKRLEWYRNAAVHEDDHTAKNALGEAYLQRLGVEQDFQKAEQWFRKAAEQGDGWVQFKLSVMYKEGFGVSQDLKAAEQWLRKAADKNIAGAIYFLAEEFAQRSDTSAYSFNIKARIAEAYYDIGYLYAIDLNIFNLDQQAIKWFHKAAEQNHGASQFNLGYMHLHGQGIAENRNEAMKWFCKSGKQGNISAQMMLGELYAEEQNNEQAAKWWHMAAEQGQCYAQCKLAEMYFQGVGVVQDEKAGFKWKRKAALRDYTCPGPK